MKIREIIEGIEPVEDECDLDEKASRKLCLSTKSNAQLGASNLSSCKSQGLRAREGHQTHKIGKSRVAVAGKKVKGEPYGGPIKDWSGH